MESLSQVGGVPVPPVVVATQALSVESHTCPIGHWQPASVTKERKRTTRCKFIKTTIGCRVAWLLQTVTALFVPFVGWAFCDAAEKMGSTGIEPVTFGFVGSTETKSALP